MNVIAKISCCYERSVLTLKLRKEYLNTMTQYTSLTPDKIVNSLIYRTQFYVNIYGSYTLLKTVRFLAHPVFKGCKILKRITWPGPRLLGMVGRPNAKT